MKEMIEQLQQGVVKRSLQALYEYLDCGYWSDCDDYFYFDNDEDLAFIIKRNCVKIRYIEFLEIIVYTDGSVSIEGENDLINEGVVLTLRNGLCKDAEEEAKQGAVVKAIIKGFF